MLVNKSYFFSNRFFFINLLKFIFLKQSILAFAFLFNHSTTDLFFFRKLAKYSGIGVVSISSSIVSNLIINGSCSFFFNTLVVYSNDLISFFLFMKHCLSNFSNFDFFSILFNTYFLSLDQWMLHYGLTSSNNHVSMFNDHISFIIIFIIINTLQHSL